MSGFLQGPRLLMFHLEHIGCLGYASPADFLLNYGTFFPVNQYVIRQSAQRTRWLRPHLILQGWTADERGARRWRCE